MKKNLMILISLLLISCINKTQTIRGDLYIKLIDLPSFYNVPDTNLKEFKKYIDSIRYQPSISKSEQNLVDYFYKLEKFHLLKTPYIKIRVDENIIKNIFLNPKEYEKVKNFTWGELTGKNKKVMLELKVTELDSSIYYSDEITSLKVVDGTTYVDK